MKTGSHGSYASSDRLRLENRAEEYGIRLREEAGR